ncbi:hypothetical protein GIW82_00260 [Planomicrobium sp. YIM 101495]|nr:hypothetical protein [Planomicrobium sp. YIM 101495]
MAVPGHFGITGFAEVIDDEDGYIERELWFAGDIGSHALDAGILVQPIEELKI